jgi:methionyl-tRNA synthetase
MAERYLGGRFERAGPGGALRQEVERELARGLEDALGLGCSARGVALVRAVDGHIEATQPFRLAKQPGQQQRVAEILYECAEAYRIASLLLWPVLPGAMEEVWRRLGLSAYGEALAGRGPGRLDEWLRWGGLPAGSPALRGPALFPRFAGGEAGRG